MKRRAAQRQTSGAAQSRPRDFKLIQMDMDSSYRANSEDRLEDVVRPELKTEFEAKKREWLAWDKWSGRTPTLFKKEFEGSRMITLCSKCYFADEGEVDAKQKFSTKGTSKTQNELTWQRFKKALEGSRDMATNRFQDAGRTDGHIQAGQAGAERVL